MLWHHAVQCATYREDHGNFVCEQKLYSEIYIEDEDFHHIMEPVVCDFHGQHPWPLRPENRCFWPLQMDACHLNFPDQCFHVVFDKAPWAKKSLSSIFFSIWPWRQSSFHQLVGSSFTRTTWRKDTRYPQFHGRTCVYLSYLMCLMMFSYVFVGSLLAQATFDTLVCSSRPNFSAQVAGLTTPQHPDGYLSIYSNPVE